MSIIQHVSGPKTTRSTGNGSSAEIIYKIDGTTDSATAHNTLAITAPATVLVESKTLVRSTTNCVPESGAGDVWVGTASYIEKTREEAEDEPDTGDSAFQFDVSGESFKVEQSNGTTSYGTNPPDFDGAIGVRGKRVEGVDIIVPKTTYGEEHFIASGSITVAYIRTLAATVGTLNNAAFKGFGARELLLMGVSGSKRGVEDWRVSFEWAAGEHKAGLTVGGIGGVSKEAHQYLWVLRELTEDATAKTLVSQVRAVYVEDIYDVSSYSVLGIGT